MMLLILRRQLFMLNPKTCVSLCHKVLVYKWPSPTSTTESDLRFMRLSSPPFKVVLGKLWPIGQIWPSACFVNEVSLEPRHSPLSMYYCLRLHLCCNASIEESWQKSHCPCQNYLLSGPLQKEFANLFLKVGSDKSKRHWQISACLNPHALLRKIGKGAIYHTKGSLEKLGVYKNHPRPSLPWVLIKHD